MEATAWLHATDYISDREIFNTIVVILARHLYYKMSPILWQTLSISILACVAITR